MRNGSLFVVVALVFLFGHASPSSAAFIYTNFGTGSTFIPAGAMPIEGGIFTPAYPFTLPIGTNVTVTSVEVPLSAVAPHSQVMMAIWTDAGGQPGTRLESFISGELPGCEGPGICVQPDPLPVHLFAASGQTVLAGGDAYWLSGTASGRGTWFTLDEPGPFAIRNDQGDPPYLWKVFSNVPHQGALRIGGELCPDCVPTVQPCPTCLPSLVPLPTTSILYVAGLLAILVVCVVRRGSFWFKHAQATVGAR